MDTEENDWALRQMAARVAAALPGDRAAALRVLALAGDIYEGLIQAGRRPRLADSNNAVSALGSPEST